MIYIDYRGLCDIYNNVVEVSGGGASGVLDEGRICLLYTSPSPRDA